MHLIFKSVFVQKAGRLPVGNNKVKVEKIYQQNLSNIGCYCRVIWDQVRTWHLT